jgi:hypothetical protein
LLAIWYQYGLKQGWFETIAQREEAERKQNTEAFNVLKGM